MEMLGSTFNSLINQYKETYQQFLNTVESNNNTLTSVSNYAFIGQSNINTIQGSSVNDCLTSCTTTNSCSGATYDSNSNVCTLSSGNGNMVSSQNQTAIVKQALYYSNQLKQLNDELTNINNQMIQYMNKNIDTYSQTQQQTNDKVNALNKNYKTLQEERSQIEEMVREYETLDSAYENGNIHVTSNYYVYIIYFIIAIVLVVILLKIGVSGGTQMGGGILQMGGGILQMGGGIIQMGGGSHIKVSPLLLVFLGIVILFNAYINHL